MSILTMELTWLIINHYIILAMPIIGLIRRTPYFPQLTFRLSVLEYTNFMAALIGNSVIAVKLFLCHGGEICWT